MGQVQYHGTQPVGWIGTFIIYLFSPDDLFSRTTVSEVLSQVVNLKHQGVLHEVRELLVVKFTLHFQSWCLGSRFSPRPRQFPSSTMKATALSVLA